VRGYFITSPTDRTPYVNAIVRLCPPCSCWTWRDFLPIRTLPLDKAFRCTWMSMCSHYRKEFIQDHTLCIFEKSPTPEKYRSWRAS